MEVFLDRISQLLPILGSDILSPIIQSILNDNNLEEYTCSRKGALAKGKRVSNGFVVFSNSTAIIKDRESAKTHGSSILSLREKLKSESSLVEKMYFIFLLKMLCSQALVQQL